MIMICSEETDCALKQLSCACPCTCMFAGYTLWAVHRKSKYNLEAYVLHSPCLEGLFDLLNQNSIVAVWRLWERQDVVKPVKLGVSK